MILIYNVPGFLMALAAGLVGVLMSFAVSSLNKPGTLATAAAVGTFGVVCIIADLIYRLRQPADSTASKLLSPSLGGMLYWIPVWIIGGGIGLLGCVVLLSKN
jgi:hypothetical protein